jgi:cyclohexanone monooxygenase
VSAPSARYDVVIVGAGFAGLYMLYKARELGLRSVVVERGAEVGGTWYWNRYPGARCDVESMYYSYSFSAELEQEWTWSQKYAPQAEIFAYLNHVADRFDLRRDIRLDTEVTAAAFNDGDADGPEWHITTGAGDSLVAQFLVMATGNLSNGQIPDIGGLDSFGGAVLHTGDWPERGWDFTGQRVVVVGTGSSGVQLIPEVARQAEHLTVLQRTPGFSIPARNAALTAESVAKIKSRYGEIREASRWSNTGSPYPPATERALDVVADDRTARYEEFWQRGGARLMGAFSDLLVVREANDTVADFVRGKIGEFVDDPDVVATLTPQGYPLGAKRVCVDTDYYVTFNRENVDLVDVSGAPLTEITRTAVRTAEGEYEADVIVFATGYDAMTGALTRIDVRGEAGVPLREVWQEGAGAYLGVAVAGFPNMFLVTGPGSPSVIGNVVVSIEQHVEWIADHIAFLRRQGLERSEATGSAQADWMQHVDEVAHKTLFPTADSWYSGANVPGKSRRFLPYVGGVGNFRRTCDEIASDGYRGFRLGSATEHSSHHESGARP